MLARIIPHWLQLQTRVTIAPDVVFRMARSLCYNKGEGIYADDDVEALRLRYVALLPKYGTLWRTMAPSTKRQPLSLLPAIENRQPVSIRVDTCDCPFDCEGCVEPILDDENQRTETSQHSSASSRDDCQSSPAASDESYSSGDTTVRFDLSHLRLESDTDGLSPSSSTSHEELEAVKANRPKGRRLVLDDDDDESDYKQTNEQGSAIIQHGDFRDTPDDDESDVSATDNRHESTDNDEEKDDISSSSASSIVGWDLSHIRLDDPDDAWSREEHSTINEDTTENNEKKGNSTLAEMIVPRKDSNIDDRIVDTSEVDLEDLNETGDRAHRKRASKLSQIRMENSQEATQPRLQDTSWNGSTEEEWVDEESGDDNNDESVSKESIQSPTVIILSDSDDDDISGDEWLQEDEDYENDRSHSLDDLSETSNPFRSSSPRASEESGTCTKSNSLLHGRKEKGQSKASFRKSRDAIARELFAEFDSVVFDGALEKVELIWSKKLRTTAGLTRMKRQTGSVRLASIELSTKIIDEHHRLRSTLLHEMCHAAAWLVDGVSKPPHGDCFKKWANRSMCKVPNVTVTTRHDYQITYKYAWACTTPKCGVVIQRHSRSVDSQRHLCGKCKGSLVEIQVPSKASGRNEGDPHTLRTKAPLSGYNIFVKQNSKSVREKLEKEHQRHGAVTQPEVLKECARLWRETSQAGSSKEI